MPSRSTFECSVSSEDALIIMRSSTAESTQWQQQQAGQSRGSSSNSSSRCCYTCLLLAACSFEAWFKLELQLQSQPSTCVQGGSWQQRQQHRRPVAAVAACVPTVG
mgnify:CR=1 FL=1